jgi:hypothetical protein
VFIMSATMTLDTKWKDGTKKLRKWNPTNPEDAYMNALVARVGLPLRAFTVCRAVQTPELDYADRQFLPLNFRTTIESSTKHLFPSTLCSKTQCLSERHSHCTHVLPYQRIDVNPEHQTADNLKEMKVLSPLEWLSWHKAHFLSLWGGVELVKKRTKLWLPGLQSHRSSEQKLTKIFKLYAFQQKTCHFFPGAYIITFLFFPPFLHHLKDQKICEKFLVIN